MDTNIQDEDDELFRKAYNSFGEEPGPEVWEKLNAQLDKKDAIYYRAKTASWKRSAYALLIVLTCFVGYEFLLKTQKKGHQEINTTESKKQPLSDSSEAHNTRPRTQKTVQDSLQVMNKSASTSLSSKSSTRSKANFSQFLSGVHNTSANGSINKNEIIAGNSIHSSKSNAGDRVVKSGQNAQPDSLKEHLLSASDKIVRKHNVTTNTTGEKTIGKTEIAADTTNGSLASNHKKDSFSTTQNQVTGQSNTAKSNTGTSIADSISTVIKSDQKPVVITEKKSDSSVAVNQSTATKIGITINHLFKRHWSFSPYAALDFSGQRLDDDHRYPEPGNRDARHEIQNRENNQVSYSLGVLARYQLSKKISLKTGLVYINSSVKINPQTLYAAANGQDINYKFITSTGYAYLQPSFDPSPTAGDSIRTEVASNKLSYVSIPFMAGYNIPAGKKLTIIPGIGFSANLLLHSKLSTEVYGNDENEKSNIVTNKIQGLDRSNFSLITDAEVHYKIASKWNLLLLPSFKYAINPITKEDVVKTYPYNFSVGLGVTYGF